ncbi:MAG: exodeoxyribonuclease VII large subunit [Candidatus Hydrogenedentota bacterium]
MSKTKTKKAETGTHVMTVSQLTRQVKGLIESGVGKVWVSGEISNWRVSPAGHVYFTLKDASSQLSAVMFRGKLAKLKFEPESGMEVMLNGLVTVYEQRGNYQIICDDMQPKGVGALQLAFDKLKAKLDAEGLFDESHKKPLPLLPKKIGIVTSPTGAAIRDMLNVLERRFADVHVLLYPARVQGDEAAPEIVAGINALNEYGVDVIVIGRGGGSLEDLWPFNEEIVVRAVHACETPIVSAVGHEIDFTLSDFVADLRAPTPSAAAELIVQERAALVDSVMQLSERLRRALASTVESIRARLDRVESSFIFRRPEELLRQQRQRVDDAAMQLERTLEESMSDYRYRLDTATRGLALLSPDAQLVGARERFVGLRGRLGVAARGTVAGKRARFGPLTAQLDALSPLAILGRGYSVVRDADTGKLVKDAAKLSKGDRVTLTFGKGSADATINEAHKN